MCTRSSNCIFLSGKPCSRVASNPAPRLSAATVASPDRRPHIRVVRLTSPLMSINLDTDLPKFDFFVFTFFSTTLLLISAVDSSLYFNQVFWESIMISVNTTKRFHALAVSSNSPPPPSPLNVLCSPNPIPMTPPKSPNATITPGI